MPGGAQRSARPTVVVPLDELCGGTCADSCFLREGVGALQTPVLTPFPASYQPRLPHPLLRPRKGRPPGTSVLAHRPLPACSLPLAAALLSRFWGAQPRGPADPVLPTPSLSGGPKLQPRLHGPLHQARVPCSPGWRSCPRPERNHPQPCFHSPCLTRCWDTDRH